MKWSYSHGHRVAAELRVSFKEDGLFNHYSAEKG